MTVLRNNTEIFNLKFEKLIKHIEVFKTVNLGISEERKLMKVLITGGSGFIGTNLIEIFASENWDILNIDYSEPKNKEHIKYWQKVDIRDKDKLSESINSFNPEYIIHLAAKTDLDGKVLEDYDSNILGTKNLLEIAEELKKLKKIIFTSSMLVCRAGYHPMGSYDYCPSTLYGESKVDGEKIVWNNKLHCDWAIIRPTSIWGPWFDIPYINFFNMLIAKHYFHIGYRSCTKTYGYVGNAVYQIEQIMLKDTSAPDNKVFYIGDYEPINIEKWANEIAQLLGYRILRVPYWMVICAAKAGDILKAIHISFPMTSFRLRNMTTDNIIDLKDTKKIAADLPYDRKNGIERTLSWMMGKRKNEEG